MILELALQYGLVLLIYRIDIICLDDKNSLLQDFTSVSMKGNSPHFTRATTIFHPKCYN